MNHYNFEFICDNQHTIIFDINIRGSDNALQLLKNKFEECMKQNDNCLVNLIKRKFNSPTSDDEIINYFVKKVKTCFSQFRMSDRQHHIVLRDDFWN